MKIAFYVLASAFALTQIGCATVHTPVSGLLYTDVKGGVMATTAVGGTAVGEACATSILGALATGDASIETAKKAGGILQVVSVDHKSENILGLFAKYCTIVYGKRAGAKAAPAASNNEG